MADGGKIRSRFNVLFTCIGRRVSLLNCFKKSAEELGIKVKFFGTDITPLSSALQLCDKQFIVNSAGHRRYISQLLEIVKHNNIKLLVPTVDLDLKILAANKDRFAAVDCAVLVSDLDVVRLCQDKRKTFKFLVKNGFDTPLTYTAAEAIAEKKLKYPCFLKPWDGYASRGNAVVKNREELLFYAKKIPNCIVQEFIAGNEYTCDCFVDFDKKVKIAVPRRRLETRAGEVSKSITAKNPLLMQTTAALVEKLQAGPGVITVQMILTKDKKLKFIEINPRFGGGAPLSIKAGADFPKWLLMYISGKKPEIKFSRFENSLLMLRYDKEVWIKGGL